MRKKIVTVVTGVALGASGMLLAGPALAAAGAPDAAAAVTSRVDRVKQALTGLVTDGTLTQSQADKVATALGNTDLGRGGHGPGRGPGRGADLDAAAKALGMTTADLRTALQGGKTLAQVAKDKGVPVATLVTALVDAEKAELAQAVKDGRLTQAEADARSADLTARVTDRVNNARPPHGPGMRPGRDGATPPATPATPAAPTPSTGS